MLLTGNEISLQREIGNIVIEPFISTNVGPNSYDVTLSSSLLVYTIRQFNITPDKKFKTSFYLDTKENNETQEIHIPEEGYILEPGHLYLGATNETATSLLYAPMLEGRSSIGRLGIQIHTTAGFGDVGWGFNEKFECTYPTWTLEISVIYPVRIYPNIKIGQVYFFQTKGNRTLYNGKYQNQQKPEASKMYMDFL